MKKIEFHRHNTNKNSNQPNPRRENKITWPTEWIPSVSDLGLFGQWHTFLFVGCTSIREKSVSFTGHLSFTWDPLKEETQLKEVWGQLIYIRPPKGKLIMGKLFSMLSQTHLFWTLGLSVYCLYYFLYIYYKIGLSFVKSLIKINITQTFLFVNTHPFNSFASISFWNIFTMICVNKIP